MNDAVLNLKWLNTFGCDLTLILNNGGPKTEPWGVSHVTIALSEFFLKIDEISLNFAIYIALDCGNRPGYSIDSLAKQTLGTVNLLRGETYLSCRKRCKTLYPTFQFYEHSKAKPDMCICIQLTDGSEQVKIKKQADSSFGYSDSCGKRIIVYPGDESTSLVII